MNKIVIIEDEFFVASHLRDLIASMGYMVTDVYHSGEAFLQQTDWKFDAAIVDIFLSKELTGLDLAVHLKEKQKPFIFLTANQDTETLKRAAKLAPSSYISKPFKPRDIQASLEILFINSSPKIEIRTHKGIEEIHPDDIYFIKSDGAYIEIYIENDKIVQRKLLKEMEDELPSTFIRVHRSYLVNKKYIDAKKAIYLKIKQYEIPVSRSYKKNLDLL